jgi:hypothetical protein
MAESLNDLMQFEHVVYSDGAGNVTDILPTRVWAPEVYLELDDDGQSLSEPVMSSREPWKLLSGFTGQHGYRGALMHPSEYIGGGLERYIRDTAGYFVAVVIDGLPTGEDDETELCGWGVAHISADTPTT